MNAPRWKDRVSALTKEAYALFLALRHPSVPWIAKAVAALVVAYALSPIDLIPDFIPVVGLLDDLILIPLGIALVVRLVPDGVLDDCRRRAGVEFASKKPKVVAGAAVVVLAWIGIVCVVVRKVVKHRL